MARETSYFLQSFNAGKGGGCDKRQAKAQLMHGYSATKGAQSWIGVLDLAQTRFFLRDLDLASENQLTPRALRAI